jgi:acetyltransferase-like isoleucine patch superfamily enzyme
MIIISGDAVAASVVTKDVHDNAMVVGSPAPSTARYRVDHLTDR